MKIAYNDLLSLGSKEWISLSKPRFVFNLCYEAWRDDLLPFKPVTEEDLCAVHDPDFVSEILTLRRENGFGDRRWEVLRQVLNANGAMVAAAQEALRSGVAFAPVSGFHHAGYAYNGGYCTFNGLVLSLLKLKREEGINRALILDFDGHFGDGTADILAKLNLPWITHLTRKAPFRTAQRAMSEAINAIMEEPDIVLYQAGADSHKADPFGAGYFTDEEWRHRDRIIFDLCSELEVPIAWNLAGGYDGKATHMLHYSTFQTAVEVFNASGLGHQPNTQPPAAGLG